MEKLHSDLQNYLLAKIQEVTELTVRRQISQDIREIVKEEVKNYLSRFMLVLAQPNDKN
jgi:hypothetical protein